MDNSKNLSQTIRVKSVWSVKIVHVDCLDTFYVDLYRDGVLFETYDKNALEEIGVEIGTRIVSTLSKVLGIKYTQLDMTFELKL